MPCAIIRYNRMPIWRLYRLKTYLFTENESNLLHPMHVCDLRKTTITSHCSANCDDKEDKTLCWKPHTTLSSLVDQRRAESLSWIVNTTNISKNSDEGCVATCVRLYLSHIGCSPSFLMLLTSSISLWVIKSMNWLWEVSIQFSSQNIPSNCHY